MFPEDANQKTARLALAPIKADDASPRKDVVLAILRSCDLVFHHSENY